MEDSIRSIFKILIKVPIWIMTMYLIFNLYTFVNSYFKILGLSYAVMQVGMENNYIPETEYETLNNYIENSIEIDGILDGVSIVGYNEDEVHRGQYGTAITVGVTAEWHSKWPVIHTVNEAGVNNTSIDVRNSVDDIHSTIQFKYTVPGLKYYPDISYGTP